MLTLDIHPFWCAETGNLLVGLHGDEWHQMPSEYYEPLMHAYWDPEEPDVLRDFY